MRFSAGQRLSVLILAVLALVVLAIWLPAQETLEFILEWSDSHRASSGWLIGAGLVVAVLLFLPASPFVLMAGFFLGVSKGLAVVWFAGAISSSLAFWLGRSLARPLIEQKLAKLPPILAITDRQIERNGFLLSLLARSAIVLPFGPVSYTLGMSKVGFRDYFLGTNLGAIPSYLLVIYIGSVSHGVAQMSTGQIPVGKREILFAVVGLASVLTLVVVIARRALRELTDSEKQ